MRERIPWWGRIGAKLVLARLPVGYRLWRRLGVFKHGAMIDPAYALAVFRKHFAVARVPAGAAFTAMELGPGDSLASALIAASHGATQCHLVDSGAYAATDPEVYRELCRYLQSQGLRPPNLESVHDTRTLLQACRGTYGTHGLASLRELRSSSVDFAWSQATLEHVRRHEFADIVRETRRIIRDDGVCSHEIDLKDHLGGALNNLRIPSRWWESEWMARSGFYTNRLRMVEIIRVFESAGFKVTSLTANRWDKLPTPVEAFAPEFRDCDRADLLVESFTVALTPA
jgi:hypothetical protein